MSGYEVLRTLRVSKVKTPILILSGMAGIEDKVRGLGFGADDYMTKPFHKDELVARIHAIVRRSKGHAQSVIVTGDLKVNLDAKTVEVGGQRVHLTGKEYQMLELLSLRKGTTLTKEMFLNHLYGGMDEPELKIIDVFICKLRKKLQAPHVLRGDRRQEELHRNRLGPRLCAARPAGFGDHVRWSPGDPQVRLVPGGKGFRVPRTDKHAAYSDNVLHRRLPVAPVIRKAFREACLEQIAFNRNRFSLSGTRGSNAEKRCWFFRLNATLSSPQASRLRPVRFADGGDQSCSWYDAGT
jgi:CheY-like chemotaxis protein